MNNLKYEPVRNLPVARFYYKGNHSHPVRRTVLVIESNSRWIRGYELRSGRTTRFPFMSPIRTFLHSKIATFNELRKGSHIRGKNRGSKTTLERTNLLGLVTTGA